MDLKKYKRNTLFWLFLKQLLCLAVYIFIEIIGFILLFSIGLNNGIILPANYSEHYLQQNKDKIAESEPFDETLVPHTCKYGLFNLNGNYLGGNFSSTVTNDAKEFLENQTLTGRRFFVIDRGNGYCIVNYDISAHFSAPILDNIFPKLELSLGVLFILIFIIIIINSALSFGKKLKKELEPLLDEIVQIHDRELNFQPKNSKIKEFNDILLSLYDMKTALSQSLKNEWETEQKRKTKISALAHDIKTPLTIIKGNAELIKEENSLSEIYQFADIINNNSDKIERYINLLIDETKNNSSANIVQTVNLTSIASDIIFQSENLCKPNSIELLTEKFISDAEVTVDMDLLQRAIINIVKNAVEHIDTDRRIKISFKYSDNKFSVTVEDFGTGFTEDALKYAKNQFYTEKVERSEEHYGLGMYIANSVAEKYNGSIEYYNKPNKTGCVVIFEIKI